MSVSSSDSNSIQPGEQWIDFYALLELPMEAGSDQLRRAIGSKYTDATANYDHRDLNRRYYYQALAERILPQCRRILLDSQKRKLYDEQCRLHRANDPRALSYVAFRAALKNPEALRDGIAPENLPSLENDAELSPPLQEEVRAAQSLVEDVETGLALDLLPTTSVTASGEKPKDEKSKGETPATDMPQATAPVTETPVTETPEVAAPQLRRIRAVENPQASVAKSTPPGQARRRTDAARDEEQTGDDGVNEASRIFDEAFVRVAGTQSYLETTPVVDQASVEAARSARRASADEVRAQTMIINGRAIDDRNRSGAPASRLSVGRADEDRPKRPRQHGQRILSPMALNLLTAIVAVMLTFTIQYFANAPATAGGGGRVPLVVSYAPELKPFLETAKAEFEKSENGAAIELILQPQNSRAGMRQALGREGTPSDVWIPSEAMWPELYNKMAASNQRSVISSPSPLALSPLVLVARADRASALKKRFADRRIPSWEALRVAVARDAPGHLGMTDPQKSGSGAVVRSFMAREWCSKHGLEWNDAALKNPALWQWLNSFEHNVPATGDTTADVVKDMVLGTRGLYWWAIAYESDAIHWLSQGKAVEIFYLPMSNFSDHPFCHITHLDAHPQARAARIRFEQFLRSDAMQRVLLQSGFRPTEIDPQTNIPQNPFRQAKYQQRGLRNSGFPVDERLNYQLINQFATQWERRFNS